MALQQRSLFLFKPRNRLRMLCHKALSSAYFEYAVLAVIFTNCIVLAIYSPMQSDSTLNAVSQYGEYVVTGLFAVEVSVKMIVLGGCMHQGAYLGWWPGGRLDWWHVLDFITTLMGFISLIPGAENYQVLRTLRLLRPLASISTSPSMRILIKSLAASLQLLGSVLALCSFMYLLYGIVGVELWLGTFRRHCVHELTGDILDVNQVCGLCPEGYVCQDTELDGATPLPNPNHGVTSFDNFGTASIVVFQTLFSEGWVQVELFTEVVSGLWATLYWVSLIVLGCFFVVNLAIGVVFASFTRVSQEEHKRAKRRAAERASAATASRVGDVGQLAREKWQKSGMLLNAAMSVRALGGKVNAAGSQSEGSDSERSDSDSDSGSEVELIGTELDGAGPGTAGGGEEADVRMALPPGLLLEEGFRGWGEAASRAEQPGVPPLDAGEPSGRVTAREVEIAVPQTARGQQPIGEGREGDDSPGVEGAQPAWMELSKRTSLLSFMPINAERFAWRKRRLYNLITSPGFQVVIAGIIVANTIALALVHHPMPARMATVLSACNFAFLTVFTLEAGLRMGGLGPRRYLEDAFNRFDLAVVAVSWVEVALDMLTSVDFPGLTVFRALRLLRILKLVKHWPGLSNLAFVILQGLSSLTSFLVILAIFIFTFALLGMQLFAGRMCAEEGCSDASVAERAACTGSFMHPVELVPAARAWGCQVFTADPATYNYDNAWTAFLATFQVFTGENWHLIMYPAIAGTSMWSSVYFIAVVIFGHYLLLNLFLAGIVRNVVDQHSLRRQNTMKRAGSRREERAPDHPLEAEGSDMSGIKPGGGTDAGGVLSPAHSTLDDLPVLASLDEPPTRIRRALSRKWSWPSVTEGSRSSLAPRAGSAFTEEDVDDVEMRSESPEVLLSRRQNGAGVERPAASGSVWSRRSTILLDYDFQESAAVIRLGTGLRNSVAPLGYRLRRLPAWLDSRAGHSMWLFSPDGRVRRACTAVVSSRYFDGVMVALIVASSALLAAQNPHDPPGGALGAALFWMDAVFTAVFVAEAAIKIVSATLVGYLRDPWNVLDFAILFPSMFALLLGSASPGLAGFKSLRTVRAIRPLRLISKSAGMRRVLRSLGRVVAQSGAIVTMLLLFWLTFAILGVELFGGRLHRCSDASRCYAPGGAADWGAPPEAECVGEWTDPADIDAGLQPRLWIAPHPHFDNVGAAMLTLFELTTLEDWDLVMQATIDARGVGRCPSQNANPAAALYTLVFVIFGSLFMFNLVVSSVIDEYVRSREHGGFDDSLLSVEQVEWVDTINSWLSTRPERLYRCPESAGRVQRALFRLVHHPAFAWGSVAAVAANTVVMMCSHWGASDLFWQVSDGLNYAFALLFALEAALKIAGMGREEYFGDNWNRLDFLLVLLSAAAFGVSQSGTSVRVDPTLVRVLRMFRAARILRAAKRATGMRMLLRTFQLALPSLWHVGSVLFLVFFVFAVLGMHLLGNAAHGGMIDDRINFETFGSSMFVLFFSLTGENWPSVLHDLLAQGKWGAIPYFLAFIAIAFFILLNLFLAVILDRFTETKRMEEYRLTPPDFSVFSAKWAEYDPKAKLLIPAVSLERLIINLPTPLGIKDMGFTRMERLRMLQSLNLEGYGAPCMVHYHEVLFALSYRISGTKLPPDVVQALLKQITVAFPSLTSLPKNERAPFRHTISAVRIQARARGFLARRHLSATRQLGMIALTDSVEALTRQKTIP